MIATKHTKSWFTSLSLSLSQSNFNAIFISQITLILVLENESHFQHLSLYSSMQNVCVYFPHLLIFHIIISMTTSARPILGKIFLCINLVYTLSFLNRVKCEVQVNDHKNSVKSSVLCAPHWSLSEVRGRNSTGLLLLGAAWTFSI